jgi:hypothetical protein
MRSFRFLVPVILGFCVAAWAEEANKGVLTIERFHYAKVSGRDGKEEYRVLSDEELKKLDQEIKQESRSFARAAIAAKAEWQKGEDTKKKSFPQSAMKLRKVQVLQTFNNREEADKKLESYQKREADAAARDRLREKNAPYNMRKTREQQAEDAMKEAERMALDERARSIFEGKLTELMTAAQKEGEAAR